ncbi:MAG: PepSY-like domain-containing protein [Alistipes sp.]|nr:PepSY-like domain-containing protein [Alistipes sp.]
MKKYLFLFLAVAAFVGCSDDDNIVPSNPKVVETLMTMYPNAQDISWGRAVGYWVAEFDNAADSLQVECTTWLDNSGKWYLTVSDIPFIALPDAVQAAFEAGGYADWFVDDVNMIERYNSEVAYVIETENDSAGDGIEVELYYTAGGVLIKSIINGNGYYDRPIVLSDSIVSYLQQTYPSYVVINLDYETGITEVDILDGTAIRELFFSASGSWILAESEVSVADLPEAVTAAIAQSDYADWEIVRVKMVESPTEQYYRIELLNADSLAQLSIKADGEVIPQ